MASVLSAAQYLIQLHPQNDPALLCLYNHLKNTMDVKQELSIQALQQFYRGALNQRHWRAYREQLDQAILTLLQAEELGFQPDSIEQMERELQTQLVEIERARDASEVLLDHLQVLHPEAKIKVIELKEGRFLSLVLYEQKRLFVHVHKPLALLKQARLQPLQPVTSLSYDDRMELVGDHRHQLELDQNHQALFWQKADAWAGVQLRGYSLKRTQNFEGGLEAQPDLFTALKQLEFYYISPDTDPLYTETMALLEKAIAFVESGDEASEAFGRNALRRGKLAQHQYFPEDKMLRLLINNLEYLLSGAVRNELEI